MSSLALFVRNGLLSPEGSFACKKNICGWSHDPIQMEKATQYHRRPACSHGQCSNRFIEKESPAKRGTIMHLEFCLFDFWSWIVYIRLCLLFFADKWLKMAFVCLNGENCHRPGAIIEDYQQWLIPELNILQKGYGDIYRQIGNIIESTNQKKSYCWQTWLTSK